MKRYSRISYLVVLLAVLAVGHGPLQAQSCNACSTSGCSFVNMQIYMPGAPVVTMKLPWITNLNVLTAMNNASIMSSSFKFTSQNYCPWGAYVTSINGASPPPGSYWQLSVNNVVTSEGPSTQFLKAGDTFSWRIVTWSDAEDKSASRQHLLHKAHIAKEQGGKTPKN